MSRKGKGKRKARTKKKALPPALKQMGEEAIGRHRARSATPEIAIEGDFDGWSFGSPYREEDEDHWTALMFDGFATRSQAVFRTFTTHLAKLCSTDYRDGNGWRPNDDELRTAIQLVKSLEPTNEAQAASSLMFIAPRAAGSTPRAM